MNRIFLLLKQMVQRDSITLLLGLFLAIIFILSTATKSFAQVIYNGTNEQRKTGVYKSEPVMKADNKDSVVEVVKQSDRVHVKTCVSFGDGECKPSKYFSTIVTEQVP